MSVATRVPAADVRRLVARHGTPLLLVDCETIRRQYRRLAAALQVKHGRKPRQRSADRSEGVKTELTRPPGEMFLVILPGLFLGTQWGRHFLHALVVRAGGVGVGHAALGIFAAQHLGTGCAADTEQGKQGGVERMRSHDSTK